MLCIADQFCWETGWKLMYAFRMEYFSCYPIKWAGAFIVNRYLWIGSWRNKGSVCWYCVQKWKMLRLGQVLTEMVWITNYRYACFSEEVSSNSVVSFELVVPKVHKAVLCSYEIIFMIRLEPESSYNYL